MFCPFATVKTQRVSVSSILATSTRERQQQKKLPRTFVKTSILSIKKKNLPPRPGYTLHFHKVILIIALIPWSADLENMYIYIDENDEVEIQNHALFNI